MADPVGIAVAYGADALAETPDWVRLDQETGVAVQSWTTQRGRSYLTDRTDAGQATIGFSDQNGSLDPTNAEGPFWPMDPNAPAAIALQHAVTGDWTSVFRGQIQDVPLTIWDQAARNTGTLPLVDLMSILAAVEVPPGDNGNTIYEATDVQTRLFALAADGDVPSGLVDFFTGNVDVQRTTYSGGEKILAAMQDAADAEFPGVSNLFVSKDGLLTFRGRLARFSPGDFGANTYNVGDSIAAAAHSSWAVLSSLTLGRDVAKIINNALFTPVGISDAAVAGQLVSDSDSITAYGPRGITGQDLIIAHDNLLDLNANDACLKFGQFYVDNFKTPATRVIQAVFRGFPPGLPNATAQWNLLCGVEIGDVIEITTTHLGTGGFAAEPYFVEGISYDAQLGMRGIWDIMMTLDLSPKTYYDSDPWS